MHTCTHTHTHTHTVHTCQYYSLSSSHPLLPEVLNSEYSNRSFALSLTLCFSSPTELTHRNTTWVCLPHYSLGFLRAGVVTASTAVSLSGRLRFTKMAAMPAAVPSALPEPTLPELGSLSRPCGPGWNFVTLSNNRAERMPCYF